MFMINVFSEKEPVTIAYTLLITKINNADANVQSFNLKTVT